MIRIFASYIEVFHASYNLWSLQPLAEPLDNLVEVIMSTPTCYYPDGTAQFAHPLFPYAWQPCTQTVDSFSSCCMTNHSLPLSPDLCRPNGLCTNLFTNENGETAPLYWSPACSDKDWNSPNCVKIPVDKCVSNPMSPFQFYKLKLNSRRENGELENQPYG